MTKKTQGIEPCLADESWSSLEESKGAAGPSLFRIDTLNAHAKRSYHVNARERARVKYGEEAVGSNPIRISTNEMDEMLKRHMRTVCMNAIQEGPTSALSWIIALQAANGATVTSAYSTYSSVYDILAVAQAHLLADQGGRIRAACLYSLITDGSTTKGSRRKEMEALHLQFPGLDPALEGSGMQIDIHSSLRHVRMRTEFFGIVPIVVERQGL